MKDGIYPDLRYNYEVIRKPTATLRVLNYVLRHIYLSFRQISYGFVNAVYTKEEQKDCGNALVQYISNSTSAFELWTE